MVATSLADLANHLGMMLKRGTGNISTVGIPKSAVFFVAIYFTAELASGKFTLVYYFFCWQLGYHLPLFLMCPLHVRWSLGTLCATAHTLTCGSRGDIFPHWFGSQPSWVCLKSWGPSNLIRSTSEEFQVLKAEFGGPQFWDISIQFRKEKCLQATRWLQC